jgi:hypothetical protein
MAREVNESESAEKHMNDRSVARPRKTAMLTAYQTTARGLVDVERKSARKAFDNARSAVVRRCNLSRLISICCGLGVIG